MPYCSVLQCRNDSRTKNLSNGGVSYHRFPKTPDLVEKWINTTGRQNWLPTKTSTICSMHFQDLDFILKKSGNKYLTDTAVPTLNILYFQSQKETAEHISGSPSSPEERKWKLEPYTHTEINEPSISTNSPQVQQQNVIQLLENKIKKKNLLIKKLLARNRRMKEKIDKYEEILSACIRKRNIQS